MRFGAPLFDTFSSPQEWIEVIKKRGYGAAYSPVSNDAADQEAIAYGKAAKDAGIIIAEHGAWGANCLSTDPVVKERSIAQCIRGLEIAELLGARCCVGLSGSRAEKWDGPHKSNLTQAAFEETAANVRKIIDSVKPKNTFYTLEPMPWTYPTDSISHLRLMEVVDRKAFAVHFDPVNMVYSPRRYYENDSYIRDFIDVLGPSIRVVHLKDILLLEQLTLQLIEVIPGDGALDYDTLLTALSSLDPDLPAITEHLSNQEEYDRAEAFIRGKAKALGLSFKSA